MDMKFPKRSERFLRRSTSSRKRLCTQHLQEWKKMDTLNLFMEMKLAGREEHITGLQRLEGIISNKSVKNGQSRKKLLINL